MGTKRETPQSDRDRRVEDVFVQTLIKKDRLASAVLQADSSWAVSSNKHPMPVARMGG